MAVLPGVPQGSISGLLLFVCFINDMFSSVSPGTNVEFYADDTKIWREIDYSSDRLPYKVIKLMIFKVGQWSITNKMKFHPPECKAV